ncbi:MAG: hypothetical protein IIB99_03515 [Planctomycetes bacterium]|nr:hypothetical protein [Planctomycetota bacterium]
MEEHPDLTPTHAYVRLGKHPLDALDRYAKVQTDWEENDGRPRALCKWIKSDGTKEYGSTFYVYFLRLRAEAYGYDPEVYQDDIITWRFDIEGNRIGQHTRWSKVGDVILVKDYMRIREGWRRCVGTDPADTYANPAVDLVGRVPMGRDPDSSETNEQSVAQTGGYRKHGLSENGHPDHVREVVGADDTGDPGIVTEVLDPIVIIGQQEHFPHKGNKFGGDTDTDNRMKFAVGGDWIERYK